MFPRVLVLGGIDPSGGAGVSADARTLQVHGAMVLPVVTVLTAQNRFGLTSFQPVRLDAMHLAWRMAVDDGPVHAIKTGLLGGVEQVEALAGWVRELRPRPPLVVDPVLTVTAGGHDSGPAVAASYRRWLAPLATVLTPNLPELRAILGEGTIATLLEQGCTAVLSKGGHGEGHELVDRLVQHVGELRFAHRRQRLGAVHGTGCALASAIAAGLAHGRPLSAACSDAIAWLQRCLSALPLPELENAPPRPLPIVPL